MFWVRVPGALFTGVIIHCRRESRLVLSFIVFPRSLQYSFFDSSGCLMWLVECRCSTSRVMQLRRLVASKERAENSDLILSNPQCSISTDFTVTAETVPWGPFSVILEYSGTERTDFSYSASISLHSLTFSVASGKVLGGGDCPFLCTEKASYSLPTDFKNLAVSERGVIIFNEFD